MEVKEVAAGAFFVPSYSEQTIIKFSPQLTSQTIVDGELLDNGENTTIDEGEAFTKDDFEKALRKVSRKVKK